MLAGEDPDDVKQRRRAHHHDLLRQWLGAWKYALELD